MMHAFLTEALDRRRLDDNLRVLPRDNSLVDFSSNDYLGLARSLLLHAAFLKNETRHQLGSTGSRLLTGNSVQCEKLEMQIAQFHGYPAGLIFTSGYNANLGILSALGNSDTCFLYDTLVHASMHDGIRLSCAKRYPWRHQDLNSLEYRLQTTTRYRKRFVCVESINSIDGKRAPLSAIVTLCERYGAHLIVDEAHATGVCGPQGKGLLAAHGLCERVFAHIVTFSKALGVQGAIVLGSTQLKEYLVNFSRPFIYTTAPSTPSLSAIKCSYDLFPHMESERQHLNALIDKMGHTTVALQPIVIGNSNAARQIARNIALQGFDVRPLMSPTVPRGQECIRVVLHAFNSFQHLESLMKIVATEITK